MVRHGDWTTAMGQVVNNPRYSTRLDGPAILTRIGRLRRACDTG